MRSILIAIIALTLALGGRALAERAIPDDNLAYPVLIILKTARATSTGSGVYLNTENATYLVTAKHVLEIGLKPDSATGTPPESELELISYSKDLPTPSRIVLSTNLATLMGSGDVKQHPTQDVVVVKLTSVVEGSKDDPKGSRRISPIPGVTLKEGGRAGIVGVGLDGVRKFDQVLVGNDAILYGYPASLGIPENPQFDSTRPLLRKGLIAGLDPDRHSIIIDGPVYRGNSGGPVIEVEPEGLGHRFWLIGILVEFIPMVERAPDFQFMQNSGYSVAKPIDFALELIK